MKFIDTKYGRINLDQVALITTDHKGCLMFWGSDNTCFLEIGDDPTEVKRVNKILDSISDPA